MPPREGRAMHIRTPDRLAVAERFALLKTVEDLTAALEGMVALTIQLLARKDLPAEVRHQLTGSGHVMAALNAIAAAEGRE
jgi:hypothetical protein